jgi:hypothetical protein
VVPRTVDALSAIPELRRWQIAEMGEGFVKALSAFKQKPGKTPPAAESPYREP